MGIGFILFSAPWLISTTLKKVAGAEFSHLFLSRIKKEKKKKVTFRKENEKKEEKFDYFH